MFTTDERYFDREAMDLHNNSATVEKFFKEAKPMLDGTPTVVLASEVFSKR